MILFGVGLYLILLILLIAFWLKRGGLSFDELLERNAHEHHLVHGVIAKHPQGDRWATFQRWMCEERALVDGHKQARS